jgi:hypothetical protein
MRFRVLLPVALLCATAAAPAWGSQADQTVRIMARATLAERTSLTVSTKVLQFVVPPGTRTASASIEFTAGVRTRPGTDVLIVSDPVPQFDGVLRFAGEGEGILAGELQAGTPAVLARWVGGGQRRGRVVFTLEGVAPGIYCIPVRLAISVL